MDGREVLTDELGRVEAALLDARERDDHGIAGEMLHRASTLLVMLRDEDGAIRRVQEALALHTRVGGVSELARDHYVLGLLLARRPRRAADAQEHLEDAAAGFRVTGETRERGRALVHLATLAIGRHAFADAADLLREAATDLADAGDPRLVLHALRLWTVVLQLQSRFDDAFVVLSRSIEIARKTGLDEDLIRLRTELFNLAGNPLVDIRIPTEPIEDLITDAARSGDANLHALVHLSHAAQLLREDAHDAALDAAQRARQIALNGPDPLAYFLSCLVIAEVEEHRGDRLAVLTILMTCQASLGDLLGDSGREPAITVIESLRKRWGDAVFDAEMTRYRAQFD